MDKGLIEKIIKFSNESCPAFTYENPLLDKDVADLLAKSCVKLLDVKNSSIKQKVLTNIRESCKVEPTDHLCIDDDVTEILKNSYDELLNDQNNNTIDSDRILDIYLMRNMKEINISSLHSPSLTPEVKQALANLKETKEEMQDTLLRDVIYWNIDGDHKNSPYLSILKSVWNVNFVSRTKTKTDDISIKLKPEIEKQLLKSSYEILETEIIDLEEWMSDQEELLNLVEMCSVSSECFQICCCIMNYLFIKTDFDRQMKKFIAIFIDLVQDKCFKMDFSLLYPIHLRHIVLLLDIRINNLTGVTRESYVKATLEKLQKLHEECENDVIMLLSHFNQWFDLYHHIIKPWH